jgi:2-dehydropantoate 2-reductase
MDKEKKHIGVFGIGAIGSAISFELQKNKSSHILHYYSRTSKKNIKLIKGSERNEIPICLQTPPFENDILNWLFVCIKEYQYPDAIDMISNLINPQTKIAVIRNGLRLKEPFLKFTDKTSILECTIDCPTQPIEGGYYEIFKYPIVTVQSGELANEFAQLFQNSETEVKQVTDYKTESWKKVCESSALGSILCLSGETCWVFENEKLRILYSDILKEGIRVAQADGAIIENDFEDNMLTKLHNYPKTKGSSMLTDRLNGNPIELGAKNEIISEIGKLKNVETPLNDLIITLLSNTNKKPAPNN